MSRPTQQERIDASMHRRPITDLANTFVKYAADNMILNKYEVGSDFRLRLDTAKKLKIMFVDGTTEIIKKYPKISHIEILYAIGDSIKNGNYPLQFRHDLCRIFHHVTTESGFEHFDIIYYVMSTIDESDIFATDVIDSATYNMQPVGDVLRFKREFDYKLGLLMQRRRGLLPMTIMHSVGNRIGLSDEPLRTELCQFFQANSGINDFNFLEWVRRTSRAPARVSPIPKPQRFGALIPDADATNSLCMMYPLYHHN